MHKYTNNLGFHENMHHVLFRPLSISFFPVSKKRSSVLDKKQESSKPQKVSQRGDQTGLHLRNTQIVLKSSNDNYIENLWYHTTQTIVY